MRGLISGLGAVLLAIGLLAIGFSMLLQIAVYRDVRIRMVEWDARFQWKEKVGTESEHAEAPYRWREAVEDGVRLTGDRLRSPVLAWGVRHALEVYLAEHDAVEERREAFGETAPFPLEPVRGVVRGPYGKFEWQSAAAEREFRARAPADLVARYDEASSVWGRLVGWLWGIGGAAAAAGLALLALGRRAVWRGDGGLGVALGCFLLAYGGHFAGYWVETWRVEPPPDAVAWDYAVLRETPAAADELARQHAEMRGLLIAIEKLAPHLRRAAFSAYLRFMIGRDEPESGLGNTTPPWFRVEPTEVVWRISWTRAQADLALGREGLDGIVIARAPVAGGPGGEVSELPEDLVNRIAVDLAGTGAGVAFGFGLVASIMALVAVLCLHAARQAEVGRSIWREGPSTLGPVLMVAGAMLVAWPFLERPLLDEPPSGKVGIVTSEIDKVMAERFEWRLDHALAMAAVAAGPAGRSWPARSVTAFRDRDGEGFERAGPGDGLRAARNAWWESGESVFVPTEVTERREVDLGDWSRASEIAGIGSLGPAHQRMRTWAAASKRWVWARGVGIALVAVGLGLSWLTFGPALRRRRGFRLEV